jgi:catechol 2,3-dioxygenase-like lactoylglutathione lyase family enzyme
VVYGSGPNSSRDGEINHRRGGRGLYFADPDGHLLEIMTVGE